MLFAGQRFGEPCAEADIQRAEAAIGEPLPVAIRELYLAFDGFLGLTDARFFWPLFGHGSSRTEPVLSHRRLFSTHTDFEVCIFRRQRLWADVGVEARFAR